MKGRLRTFAALGLAALVTAIAATPCRADFLAGVTLLNNQLISIDTTTGVGSLVGPLAGNPTPFGVVSSGNRLLTFDSIADVIRQINPSTGGTLATFNIGIGPVLGQGGLAFQTTNVGFLTHPFQGVKKGDFFGKTRPFRIFP